VAEVADRVAVMYAGQVVEYCDVRTAFRRTQHPYTAGLLASLPRLGVEQERLRVIPGTVPNPARFPSGCRFHPRCPLTQDRCRTQAPDLVERAPGHRVRCWRADEIEAGTAKPVGEAVVS
jgi:oligopeptide/dipeptide ABC transporter ATP-binding protein